MLASSAQPAGTHYVVRPVFDGIAEQYDRLFTDTLIGRIQRGLVHEVLRRCFKAGDRVLELNCGTGEDALYLASRGVDVVACDVSERMVAVASQKQEMFRARFPVKFVVCANESLDCLGNAETFDGALSNFGGLNCTDDLTQVSYQLARLIRPDGELIICLLGRHCIWEIVCYCAQGRWRKAFRRVKEGGTLARIGNAELRVFYPSICEVRSAFEPAFRLVARRGIGVAVPPSWMEPMVRPWPWVVRLLGLFDLYAGGIPMLRGAGDHVLLRFVRVK